MKFLPLRQPQNLLLLVALLLLCLYTALCAFSALLPTDGEYHRILLTKANYAGFGAIAMCVISYIAAPRFFRRLLALTLLLALFGFINFLPITFSMGITLGEIPVGVSPFGLLALAVFYFLNRTPTNAFIRTHLLPAPTPERTTQLRREAIDQFKQTFARKSDDSLQQIVQERKLVATAVSAAQELLTERRGNSSSTT